MELQEGIELEEDRNMLQAANIGSVSSTSKHKHKDGVEAAPVVL